MAESRSKRSKLITIGLGGVVVLVLAALGIDWVSRRLLKQINEAEPASAAVSRTKGSADNFVYNGDFEKGTAEWASGGATVTAVQGGQAGQCLQLLGDGSQSQYAIAWNVAQLEMGRDYELSFYVKSGDSGEQQYRGGVWDQKRSTWITTADGQSTSTWTRRAVRFTNTARDPVSVELMRLAPGTGDLLFDSVQLRPANPGDNMIVNGDFEAGTNNWESGDASLTTVAGGESGQALQLTGLKGDSQFAIQWKAATLPPATTADLTVWVKSGASKDERFRVGIWDATGASWVAYQDGVATSVWQKVSMSFQTKTGNPLAVELVKSTPSHGSLLFDSVELHSRK